MPKFEEIVGAFTHDSKQAQRSFPQSAWHAGLGGFEQERPDVRPGPGAKQSHASP